MADRVSHPGDGVVYFAGDCDATPGEQATLAAAIKASLGDDIAREVLAALSRALDQDGDA